MKKLSYCFLFLALTVTVMAQNDNGTDTLNTESVNPFLYNYTTSSINNLFNEKIQPGLNNRISIDFDYNLTSPQLPSGMVFSLLFKNDIKTSVINRADNRIKDNLKMADMLTAGISYRRYMKKWDGTFYFSYNHRQMRNIVAGKEAFQTVFYGNSRFENDTADFSNIKVYNYIYNQYSLGIKKVIDYGKTQFQFGVGLSFLQVINQQEIVTGNTTLYTAPDGEYIDVNYDLTFNTAKEGATSYGALNGLGASGDLNLGFSQGNKWKFTVDINDLGYVAFRKNPTNYTGVKNVHFQGLVLPDLLSFSGQTFDTLNLDSTVRSYLPNKSSNRYFLFMPFSITGVFSKPVLNEKLVLNFGLQYRHLPKFYAYGFVKVNYFIKPDMVVSGYLGGGGYSLVNFGVEFSKHWKYFDFALGSNNLPGLIVPSHVPGASLYLRLASTF